MKIGVVVDGQAESMALRGITGRINTSGKTILAPAYADMQPRSTAQQIARAAQSKVEFLAARGADQILVLIDMEDNPGCPGDYSARLQNGFANLGLDVIVIAKVRCFENWLIADPAAFKKMKARYKVTRMFERAVAPNKADSHSPIHAARLIDSIAVKHKYHKRKDAIAIGAKLDISTAGRNSRSFRRLLRCLGHPDYVAQSRNPG